MPRTETLVAFMVTLLVEEALNLAISAEVGAVPPLQFPPVVQFSSAPAPIQLMVAALASRIDTNATTNSTNAIRRKSGFLEIEIMILLHGGGGDAVLDSAYQPESTGCKSPHLHRFESYPQRV